MAKIKIGSLNCHGQSKMSTAKQLFIESILKQSKQDILCLQETFIDDETFENCDYLTANYNIIKNNNINNYGTACLVKNIFNINDIRIDTEGRIIIFNLGDVTITNVYPKAGTDSESRKHRENMFSQTIPNMLRLRKKQLILAGDWNCITDKKDCTHHYEMKMSPSLKRLITLLGVKDDFRTLHKDLCHFSRYYSKQASQEGATRIDRIYSSDNLIPISAKYIPAAMSDHMLCEVVLRIKETLEVISIPKPKLPFKIRPSIVDNADFQNEVKHLIKE